MSLRNRPLLLLMLLLLPVSLQAQSRILRGRVQDRVTGSPIIGATVRLEGLGSLITNERGEFLFTDVSTGSHSLQVQALGYTTMLMRIELSADTSLVIALAPNPVRIDSLQVVTRWVNVSGRLTERASGRPVMDGAVFASERRHTRSNVVGQFQFKRVPAGVPFEIQVVAFPYETVLVSFLPERDTTLTFALSPDTFVQRLIDRQIQRLEARMAQAQGEEFAITRDKLARFDRGTLHDAFIEIMKVAPYTSTNPTVCFFVDEKQIVAEYPLEFLKPEEVERVEVLHNGSTVRVYTRRFLATMISSDVKLAKPGFSQPPRGFRGQLGPASCG